MVIILLLAAAPWVVSSVWGPGIVESVVGAEIKGRLAVKTVSISWFGNVEVEGLELFDPEDRKVVGADRITLKKNLFGLISSWANLNELEISKPQLLLYLGEDGDISLLRAIEPPVVAEGPAAPMPELHGKLKLIDGQGEIITYDNRRRKLSFSGQCDLATLNDIKVSFQAGAEGIGEIKGQTEIADLAPGGLIDLDNMSVSISMETKSPIELGAVADLAGSKGIGGAATLKIDGAFAGGKLDGKFGASVSKLVAAQTEAEKANPIDAEISGGISADEAGSHGDFSLKAPEAGSASVKFDYKTPDKGWSLDTAKLLEALAKGQMIELPEFTIEPQANLNVARLAAAAPDLLNIRSDAKLQELTVKVSGAVVRGGKRPEMLGNIEVGQARAIVNGKDVVWKPSKAAVDIKTDENSMLQIKNVDVKVGENLVSVNASGTANNIELKAGAKLAELKQQLGQIFDLEKLVLTGNMSLAGSIKRTESAAGTDVENMAVDLEAVAESVEYRPDRKVEGQTLALDTKADWKADISRSGDSISAKGLLRLDKLSAAFAGKKLQQDTATVDHDITFDNKRGDLTMRKMKVISAPATLDATGKVTGLTSEAPQLDVSGNYAAQFEKLAPIVKQFEPEYAKGLAKLKDMSGKFALAGSADSLKGTLDADGHSGKINAVFQYAEADKGFAVDVQKLIDAAWAGKPISLPNVTLTIDGQVKPAVLFSAAEPFLEQTDLKLTGGQVELTGVRIRGGSQPSATGKITLTDIAGSRADKPFTLARTEVVVSAQTDSSGKITSADASVDLGPAGAATMLNKPTESSLEAALDLDELAKQLAYFADLDGAEFSGRIQTKITASRTKPGETRASIAATLRAVNALYAPGKPADAEPMAFTGEAAWTGDADYREQTLAATGKAVLKNILLKIGDQQIQQKQADLTHDLTLDLANSNVEVKTLKLTSDPAAFDLSGTIRQFDKKPVMDVSGKYAIAWGALTPIVRQFSPDLPATLASLAKTSGTFQLADEAGRWKGKFSLTGDIGVLNGSFSAAPAEFTAEVIDKAVKAITSGKPFVLPEASVELDGHIMCAPALAAAAALAELPEDLKLTGGRVSINRVSFRGGSKPTLNADILAGEFAGTRAGKPIRIDDITILVAAATDSAGRLQIEKAVFKSGFAKGNASGSIGDFSLKADADLPRFKSQLDQFVDLNMQLAGTIDIDATIRKVGDSYDQLDARLDAKASNFQYIAGPPAGSKDKPAPLKPRTFTIASTGLINLKTEVIKIAKMQARFEPELLTVNMGGKVSNVNSQWMLDLAGDYSGQWEQINGLLEELSPGVTQTLALTGKTSGKFIATGSATNPTVTTTDDGLAGNTVLAWDKGNALGLPLGEGRITPQLSRGKLVLPLTEFPASGGTGRIGATVDMSSEEPVLRLPKTLQVLKEVQLTQRFSKEVLSRVNPIFAGLGYVKGKVDLRFDGVEIPMGDSMNTGGKGTGRLDLSEMKIKPSGILTQLLKWQGVPTEVDYYTVDMSGIDFLIRNGGVEYDNFTFTFPEDVKIGFSGRVGFDDSVSMKVWTPVTATLLRKLGVSGPVDDYARVLKGARVAIPMAGSRKTPKLDLSRVDVKPLIKKAAENLLKEKAGGLLRDKLFPKLKIP